MRESILDTHTVFNQSPIYGGHNNWVSDPLLRRIVGEVPAEVRKGLEAHGMWAGHYETYELARLANRHTPSLRTHDAKGNRLDLVDFHPAYHAMMRKSMSAGMHCSIWDDDEAEQGKRNLLRAARYYMTSAVETGHLCPTMR